MSHFAVLVVGNDIGKQLQPFHEFECNGINDEYVEDNEVTDKVLDEDGNLSRAIRRTNSNARWYWVVAGLGSLN